MSCRALLHPLWWGSLCLLLVNDHLLKGAGVLHPWLTGKLSDVAGLLMAPMLCAALLRVGSLRAVLACHAAVGLVFAALKTVPAASAVAVGAGALVGLRAQIVCDPTDLIALPALGVSWCVLGRTLAFDGILRAHQRLIVGFGLALGVLATVATSPPPPKVAGVGRAQDGDIAIRACAHLFLFDARTGRTRAQLPLGDNGFSANSDWVLSWPANGWVLRAWSIQERRLRWERPMPFADCNASAEKRRVFVNCPVHVEMRRWSDGQRLWGTTGTAQGHSDELVLVAQDGRLRVLDAETGRELFSRPALFDQVCLLGDSLYGITHGKLVRLDARTGAAVAEVTLSVPDALIFCADSVPADQPPEFTDEWRLPTMQEPGAPLVTTVTTVPGALIAYDPETLAELWRYPLTDRFIPRDFALAASRDVVTLSDSGWSMGLDARTGATLWGTIERQGPQRRASVEPLVLVSENRCSVYASDARTGRELWRRDLGRDMVPRQTPPTDR